MDHMNYGLAPLNFKDPQPSTPGFSRRAFLVTSLASGFALASGAVQAQAITTGDEGLTAGEIKIPVADGSIPGYRALPRGGKNLPVMLVIQEIFGVHEHIKDLCRRYAKQGYYAIAPEMFARQGDVSKMTDINQILTDVVSKVPDAQVMRDIDATLAFAKASGSADAGSVGIIGFCWGGRTVWLYARHNPKIKAGVAYYGLLSGMAPSDLKPKDPVDIASELTVPVLGLYASVDHYIPMDVVEKMRTSLARGDSGSQIVVFPGVDHGFNADYRPTYDRATAEYANELAFDWFKDNGV
jgi:carboxymethylenebutenolidase